MLVLVLFTFASPQTYALPDELEVYQDETTKQGQFAVDVISNYTASGLRRPATERLSSSFHLLQLNPDFSYGITNNSQIGLQLFSSISLGGNVRVDGSRVEFLTVPIRPDVEDGDGLFLGSLFEIGHLPPTLSTNHLDAEIFLILGYRVGRWTFATNPEIDFKVSGSGSSGTGLAAKFKAAYRTDYGYNIGLEHYGNLGQLHHIGPLNRQSQQTFAVVDFKAQEMAVNVGVGRGWNDYSDRWVIKAVVSFAFGN